MSKLTTETTVIVRLQVEGLHRWKDAKDKCPAMSILSDMHRHVFHIECEKKVTHTDRDVEFILIKRRIESFIEAKWGRSPAHFHDLSCESIALALVIEFGLTMCQVLEDNENGGRVVATN